jgi:hypothetical protein
LVAAVATTAASFDGRGSLRPERQERRLCFVIVVIIDKPRCNTTLVLLFLLKARRSSDDP